MAKVWLIETADICDGEDWDTEVFSTYEKARERFDCLTEHFKLLYSESILFDGEEGKYFETDGDYCRYNYGIHYGSFYIREVEAK